MLVRILDWSETVLKRYRDIGSTSIACITMIPTESNSHFNNYGAKISFALLGLLLALHQQPFSTADELRKNYDQTFSPPAQTPLPHSHSFNFKLLFNLHVNLSLNLNIT